MTLGRFIVFVLLTLDMSLFVQAFPLGSSAGTQTHIFHGLKIVAANRQIKRKMERR